MTLQWAILASVVAVEAAIAIILTLPWPQLLRSRVVALASLLLKPFSGILPFATFQLMDLYWKKEHLLMCVGEVCTAAERDRYVKSTGEAKVGARGHRPPLATDGSSGEDKGTSNAHENEAVESRGGMES